MKQTEKDPSLFVHQIVKSNSAGASQWVSKPIRVQRKRKKGYRMPENTVSVTRPGKWGNPYKVGETDAFGQYISDVDTALKLYRIYINALLLVLPDWLEPLKGKNLACFCPEGSKCHADILIELANH